MVLAALVEETKNKLRLHCPEPLTTNNNKKNHSKKWITQQLKANGKVRKENEGKGRQTYRDKREGPWQGGGEAETVNSRKRGEDGSASKDFAFAG